MAQDADDFLNESSGGDSYEALKFKEVGDKASGVIMDEPRTVLRKSLKDDGSMEKQLPINLETPSGPRTLWVRKGFMGGAVSDAVKEAGKAGLQVGGKLAIKLVELRDTGKPQPAKVFKAQYEPPANTTSVDDIFDDDTF